MFGLDPVRAGTIELHQGAALNLSGFQPDKALTGGLDYLSENRKDEGLAQNLSITENTTLSAVRKNARFGFLKLGEEHATAAKWAETLDVRCASVSQPVNALSGGNQQKVILGKWLATNPKILLLDEPTRGIDVGAKGEIYSLIHELGADGLAVIVVSSELPEILALSDRIVVLCEGQMTAAFDRGDADEESIMNAALPN